MSKEYVKPAYASQIPFTLMNWDDRDSLTGKLLEVIEAVMPEGSQLTATKNLIKKTTSLFWQDRYEMVFGTLKSFGEIPSDDKESFNGYCEALWEEALRVNHSSIYN